jgi:hypothetical protein
LILKWDLLFSKCALTWVNLYCYVEDGTAEEMLGAWAASVSSGGRDGNGGGRGGVSDKDKTQLNVSPAAHLGIVSLVTLYFGWSCVKAAVGNAWDSVGLYKLNPVDP